MNLKKIALSVLLTVAIICNMGVLPVLADAAGDTSTAITIKINGGDATISGTSLSDAITGNNVTATDIKTLAITAGKVTEADWTYIKNLSALTDFTVEEAVSSVADIPDSPEDIYGNVSDSIFPTSIVNVTIPKITAIGYGAFYKCKMLVTATFPAATTIWDRAFYGCTSLETATFHGATTIWDRAFYGCSSLVTANFPVATKIFSGAFYGCSSLATANFPVATEIGGSAFYGCSSLATANFPVAISIEGSVFSGCSSLTTANFPVATLFWDTTFSGCTSLATLTLGAKPPHVDQGAFNPCPTPRTLIVPVGAKTTYEADTNGYDNITKLWYDWTIKEYDTNVPVTGVSLDKSTLSLAVGDNSTLVATIAPDNATNKAVTWASDATDVATVDANGKVTAVKAGIATITVTSTNGDKTATCTVTVTGAPTPPLPPIDGGDTGNTHNSGNGHDSSTVGVTVVTPPATQDNPTPPTTVEIKAPATIGKNGNASITITDKTVADAIKKAQDEAKKNGTEKNGVAVELKVDTGKKTLDSISAKLPKEVQDSLVEGKVSEFKITSSLVDLTFDNKALQAIQKQAGGDVTINASKADVSKLSKEAQKEIGNRPVFNLSITGKDGKTISDFDGGSATVSIPYTLQTGENPDNLQAYFIDAKGKLHEVTSTYAPVTKCMVFVTNHFSTYGIGYKENAPKFSDIEKHWAKNDIDFVTARRLLSGMDKTTFSPNTAMTRGMFVTALGRLAGADVSGYQNSSFADIKSTDYFMGYVEWASKNGIVKGTSATTFAPNAAISRQEMAVIMTNYAKTMNYTLPKTRTAVTFADNASIASWSADAVKSMQMAGVIMGKDGNRFDPTATATRAEASAVLHRYVELVIDKATAH